MSRRRFAVSSYLLITVLLFLGLVSKNVFGAQAADEKKDWKHLIPTSLQYKHPSPTDKGNAFPDWIKAIQHFTNAKDSALVTIAKGTHRDSSEFPREPTRNHLNRWIMKNSKSLDLLDHGIEKGKIIFPGHPIPDDITILIRLAEIKALDVKRSCTSNKTKSALLKAKQLLRMGEMISRGCNSILLYAVGSLCRRVSCATLRWLAHRENVSKELLHEMLLSLPSLPPTREALAQAYRGEFLWAVTTLDQQVSRVLKEKNFNEIINYMDKEIRRTAKTHEEMEKWKFWTKVQVVDPTLTIKRLGGYYLRCLRNTELPWEKLDREIGADVNAFGKDYLARLQKMSTIYEQTIGSGRSPSLAEMKIMAKGLHNIAGDAATVVGMPNPLRQSMIAFGDYADRRATRIVLAIEIFRRQNQRLPQTLGALVRTKILDEIPLDPFSDKSFHYSVNRALLWSVAMNGKDDGGIGAGDIGIVEDKDYIWRVALPQRAKSVEARHEKTEPKADE